MRESHPDAMTLPPAVGGAPVPRAAPITVAMYRRAKLALPARPQGSCAPYQTSTYYVPRGRAPEAVTPESTLAAVVVTWAPCYRQALPARPERMFTGWRCLNPLVAEEYMPSV